MIASVPDVCIHFTLTSISSKTNSKQAGGVVIRGDCLKGKQGGFLICPFGAKMSISLYLSRPKMIENC